MRGSYYWPNFFFCGSVATSGSGPPHYRGFGITIRHTTFSRTPLDDVDSYLTTHNRQTSMSMAGFEPAIPASEQSKTHTLDRAGIGLYSILLQMFKGAHVMEDEMGGICSTNKKD